MNKFQIIAVIIIGVFYVAYLTKMMLQRKKGIETNQLGKGIKNVKTLKVEKMLSIASFVIIPSELISIIFNTHYFLSEQVRYVGLGIAAVGVIIFITAMYTMRDSWRAGIPDKDKTKMVTGGIYRVSRNPAFLGFDLTYIGILLAFDNPILLVATVFVMVMMHLQILEEEKFLSVVFDKEYEEYKGKTGRYFILF
jgi:protein-S-isoprenylcysteine O-methyltransferase Ste14